MPGLSDLPRNGSSLDARRPLSVGYFEFDPIPPSATFVQKILNFRVFLNSIFRSLRAWKIFYPLILEKGCGIFVFHEARVDGHH